MKCLNCQEKTLNPKFCSKSCSVSFNNKLKPKRKPEHKCKNCEKPINAKKTYCSEECVSEYKKNNKKQIKTNYQQLKEWRQRQKIKAVEYKGGKCQICDYNKSISTLCFHHTKPSEKLFSISPCDKSWNKIKLELDKCILLCQNCHREEHDKTTPKTDYRQKNKIKSVEYMGEKCKNCGYNKCIQALDFHHINPDEKEFSLSKLMNHKFETIIKELNKCILLCSNCHMETHQELYDKIETKYMVATVGIEPTA